EPLQLDPGVLGGELPIDRLSEGVALGLPDGHLTGECLPVREAPIQARHGHHAQLDLRIVETRRRRWARSASVRLTMCFLGILRASRRMEIARTGCATWEWTRTQCVEPAS